MKRKTFRVLPCTGLAIGLLAIICDATSFRAAYSSVNGTQYSASAAALPFYTVIDLGKDVFPFGINDKGQVLLEDSSGNLIRWKLEGQETLQVDSSRSVLDAFITADGRVIANTISNAGSFDVPVYWASDSSDFNNLPLPYAPVSEDDDFYSYVASVSSQGVVTIFTYVGSFFDGYSEGYQYTSLATNFPSSSWSELSTYYSSFDWNSEENTFSGDDYIVYDVNDHQDFVGEFGDANGDSVYGMNADFPLSFEPFIINNNRVIVGLSLDGEESLMISDYWGTRRLHQNSSFLEVLFSGISSPSDGLEGIVSGGNYWKRMTERDQNGNSTQIPSPDFVRANLDSLIDPEGPWSFLEATRISENGKLIVGEGLKNDELHGFLLVEGGLRADLNRNGIIDTDDYFNIDGSRAFHFWINDNKEESESAGEDIPGQSVADYQNNVVDSVRDLVDFFPVLLDLKPFVDAHDVNDIEIILSGAEFNRLIYPGSSMSFPGFTAEEARNYLTDPLVARELGTASTENLGGGKSLSSDDIERIREGYGVFLFEGCTASTTTVELEVELKVDGERIFQTSLPIMLSSVEDMFRHKNLLAAANSPLQGQGPGPVDRSNNPSGFPDELLSENKDLVFVHGYNVNPADARGWQAAMFKRFFWSGSNARFHGITWYGAETQSFGFTPDYHINVVNAMQTSSALAQYVNGLASEVSVAAHSLGNMLVSDAITYHNLDVKNYFMLNAAVAVEAYGDSAASDLMVHPTWKRNEIPARLQANQWHVLFDSADNRSQLTWKGYYSGILQGGVNIWNYHSSVDEVFDPNGSYPDTTLGGVLGTLWTGMWDSTSRGRHAWAMQEIYKGRNYFTNEVLGSTYAGWSIEPKFRKYEWVKERKRRLVRRFVGYETNEQLLTDEYLKTEPFFNRKVVPDLYAPGEGAMSTGSLFVDSEYEVGKPWKERLLAQAIPADSLAAGRVSSTEIDLQGDGFNIDMEEEMKERFGLGEDDFYWVENREEVDWFHSDLKEVGYPYTHLLFDSILEKGGLK